MASSSAWGSGPSLAAATRRSTSRSRAPSRPALADDRGERDVLEEVHLPERLPLRGIGEVDLHEWPLDPEQGVAQGDARVRQPAGVDDGDVEVARMQAVDQGALVVRLEEVDLEPQLGRPNADPRVQLVEGLAPVDLRLARAQQVQVRALQDEHAGHAAALRGAPASAAAIPASTASAGTSSRTTTPSAVGSTQRRRPPATFLSPAKRAATESAPTPGAEVARPNRSRSPVIRAARSSGVTPRRRPTATAPRSPCATASPWLMPR